jgi:hypothetical protein
METSTDIIMGTIRTFPGCTIKELVRKTDLSMVDLVIGLSVLVDRKKLVIRKSKGEGNNYEYWRSGTGYASFD